MPTRISPEVRPALPQDFARGRANTPVDLIVLHTTEGSSIDGAARWWDEAEVIASAHYIVHGRRIVQRVAEGDTAFHAGSRLYNRRSIGIEVVGFSASRDTWTPEVVATLAQLCADIVDRHGIPLDRHHLIGHREVPDGKGGWGGAGHHTDPGVLIPWDDLLESIHAELYGTPLEPAPVPPAAPVRFGEGT
jgi:N-acetyl-anhydromuramyl-L-alanine amidase AmpD